MSMSEDVGCRLPVPGQSTASAAKSASYSMTTSYKHLHACASPSSAGSPKQDRPASQRQVGRLCSSGIFAVCRQKS